MPFKFNYVCDFLSQLERIKNHDPPLLPKDVDLESRRVVEHWFREHRRDIDDPATNDVALLSTFFPERRADRVYGFQEARLSRLIGRALHLNSARTKALQGWKISGNGDLGTCVERALKDFDCEPKPGAFVTVEEIDHALQELASRCRFSGPEVRSTSSKTEPLTILKRIFLRLKSFEAKWFTRLLLKDFSPVVLKWNSTLTAYHFLLPGLLNFQNSFTASIELLRGPLKRYHANPDETSRRLFKQEAVKLISPRIGIKVGRPLFFKARSISHCLKMAGNEKWAMERKYDGEYCEIHIDLSRETNCIQIFSKSGKDSTEDRRAVHQTILEALRIAKPDCVFQRRCIVLGELMVYSDLEQRILEFHEIRKHVSRSGLFFGTDKDSQAQGHEHLMILFFDVLLIDDDILMTRDYSERRTALRKLVKKRPGYAMTSEWRVVDFGRDGAAEAIIYQFAAALAYRTEGLVLKPADLPYFSFDTPKDRDPRHYFIKLKKDYISELSQERDIADFAVVGASYDCQQALRLGLRDLQFTHFHLGCIVNPDGVRFGHRPVYEVVASVGEDLCIPKTEIQALNDYGRFCCKPFERLGNRLKNPEEFDLLLDQTPASKMSVIFKEPCVVEVLGSGFEKPGNKSYFMLRHPRILKLHLDRSCKDAVTMEELQRMAEQARSSPAEGESQETMRLVEKLRGKVERKVERDRLSLSTPRTDSTVSPSSADRKTDRSSPISSNASIRKKSDSSTFVQVDTVELPGEEHQGTKQAKHRLQLTQITIKDPVQTLSTSSADRSADKLGVLGTMKKTSTLFAVTSAQKRLLDEPSDLHPTKRCRTENSTTLPLSSSRPTLARCSSCGKFKKPGNLSRDPLADITSKQTT